MIKLGSYFRKQIVERLNRDISNSGSLFVVQYAKLSSPQMTSLRSHLKAQRARLVVTKNSLIRCALSESNINGLNEMLSGPTALVAASADITAVSKVLTKFARENTALVLKGAFFKGSILKQKDIETISNLPSKDVLIAQVVMALKSPLAGLVFTLKGPLNKLAVVLNQIKDKKK